MTPTETKIKLSTITESILSERLDFSALVEALKELKTLLYSVSGLNGDSTENNEDIFLPTGKAIGPKWAALCVDDMLRTRQFMRGVVKAVEHVRLTQTGKPVHILYAGPGPFATLVLPLFALYSPTDLQLTFLEVNEHTIKTLKKTLKGLGANEYLRAIHQCDAAVFKLPVPTEADILVVECLQRSLAAEPQVAITFNLLPQLNKNVILLPQQISLHVALINNKKKNEYNAILDGLQRLDYFENSEAVFILNKTKVLQKTLSFTKEGFCFPEREVLFSKEQLAQNDMVAITTEITVFEDIALTLDECGLTIPLLLAYLSKNDGITGVKTKYVVSEKPGLETVLLQGRNIQ